jgi:hypothetical protein
MFVSLVITDDGRTIAAVPDARLLAIVEADTWKPMRHRSPPGGCLE